MSARNTLKNKAIRRAEREARKGEFIPAQLSFEIPNTKLVTDEETGEEVSEVVEGPKRFFNLPSRSDRRGNRVRGRRGKSL